MITLSYDDVVKILGHEPTERIYQLLQAQAALTMSVYNIPLTDEYKGHIVADNQTWENGDYVLPYTQH